MAARAAAAAARHLILIPRMATNFSTCLVDEEHATCHRKSFAVSNEIRSMPCPVSCQVAESQCGYVTEVKTSRQKPTCQCDYVIEIKPSLQSGSLFEHHRNDLLARVHVLLYLRYRTRSLSTCTSPVSMTLEMLSMQRHGSVKMNCQKQ